MTSLPAVKPRVVLNALRRNGFEILRIRGSHHQLLNPSTKRRVTVPLHNRDLSRATLRSIIQQAGMTEEDFFKLL
jgi:predicted RNA binding protein YcfA (HicA-like mRNA interferase family)